MNKLETYQKYADKCAGELGITDKVTLRWSGTDCVVASRHAAHCHTGNKTLLRGTICIRRMRMTIKYWHNLIAHEVSHLAIKSNHNSATFAKRMVALGVANSRERLMAKSGQKHKHIWNTRYFQNGVYVYSTCMICHKHSK